MIYDNVRAEGLVPLKSDNHSLWEATAHLTGYPPTYVRLYTIVYSLVNTNQIVENVSDIYLSKKIICRVALLHMMYTPVHFISR